MKPQKPTINGPILTSVAEGQQYVDTPTFKSVPVYCGTEPMVGQVVRYYTRTPLRWVKPDESGAMNNGTNI